MVIADLTITSSLETMKIGLKCSVLEKTLAFEIIQGLFFYYKLFSSPHHQEELTNLY